MFWSSDVDEEGDQLCEGIFSGKTFTVLGFDEEERVQLESFIKERGGLFRFPHTIVRTKT